MSLFRIRTKQKCVAPVITNVEQSGNKEILVYWNANDVNNGEKTSINMQVSLNAGKTYTTIYTANNLTSPIRINSDVLQNVNKSDKAIQLRLQISSGKCGALTSNVYDTVMRYTPLSQLYWYDSNYGEEQGERNGVDNMIMFYANADREDVKSIIVEHRINNEVHRIIPLENFKYTIQDALEGTNTYRGRFEYEDGTIVYSNTLTYHNSDIEAEDEEKVCNTYFAMLNTGLLLGDLSGRVVYRDCQGDEQVVSLSALKTMAIGSKSNRQKYFCGTEILSQTDNVVVSLYKAGVCELPNDEEENDEELIPVKPNNKMDIIPVISFDNSSVSFYLDYDNNDWFYSLDKNAIQSVEWYVESLHKDQGSVKFKVDATMDYKNTTDIERLGGIREIEGDFRLYDTYPIVYATLMITDVNGYVYLSNQAVGYYSSVDKRDNDRDGQDRDWEAYHYDRDYE